MAGRRLLAVVAAIAVAAFAVDLLVQPGGALATMRIDDLGELTAALAATVGSALAARRSHLRRRRSWALLAVGCGGWAAGQAVWSWYELVAGRDTPFPSWADVGFLLFPVAALVALLVRPSAAFRGQGRIRVALDGVLIAASLFVVSWATALGEVYRAGADSMLAATVSLAYPASDMVLLTVTVVVLTYARTGARRGLMLLAAGVVGLAVADSGFAYLTTVGTYQTSDLVDAGWVAGFLLIAVAAAYDEVDGGPTTVTVAPRAALLLPYLPATVALVTTLVEAANSRVDTAGVVAAAVLAVALVARQVVVLLDNRSLMSRIAHQAFHDVLTGLANRALFLDRLDHALDLHGRDLRSVGILLVDLDDFKSVNDTLGHPCGDELLVRVSERLRASVRTGDTVARLGGDEFAVLVEDGGEPIETATRLLRALDQPVTIAGRDIPVRASIGVAPLDPDEATVSGTELLKRADVAMYEAKRAGKSTVVVFHAGLAEADSRDLDMRAALAADLASGRIDVAYQPILDAHGDIVGVEALARWSWSGEAVSPATFLPMARRLGRLPDLDETVLRTAVHEVRAWADVTLSVNVSGETLADPGFADRVATLLADQGLPGRRLSVEVLESSLVEQDTAALATIAALRALGAQVSVDDFGAGYASLARLRALEPDIVKVDRSLIAAEVDGQAASALLVGLVDLAHRLGATVVAEGVETPQQHAAAVAAGCDAVQGFLWGRPGPAEQWRGAASRPRTVPTLS